MTSLSIETETEGTFDTTVFSNVQEPMTAARDFVKTESVVSTDSSIAMIPSELA